MLQEGYRQIYTPGEYFLELEWFGVLADILQAFYPSSEGGLEGRGHQTKSMPKSTWLEVIDMTQANIEQEN